MKKLNKIIALCLVAALLVSITGCGGDSEKQANNTIVWYMKKPVENLENQQGVEAEANKMIAEKLDAKLHFNMIDAASWEQKTKLLGASKESVDLVMTANWTNKLIDNVKNGSFMELNDLLEKYGQDIMAKVDPRAWEAVTFNGKIMAIPSQQAYSSPQSFVFKKDLVDKYNFDYKNCKTLKDLEPFLAEIKANEPNITPILAVSNDIALPYPDTTEQIVAGVVYDYETGKLITRYSEEDDVVLDVGRTMHEFYEKGYIAKDASTKTEYTSEARSGKYAVMHHAGTATEDGSKATSIYGFDCTESVVLHPVITTNSFTASCTAIGVNCKNPELAMQVLNLIWADPKLSNTLAFGIEGQDYIVTAGEGTDNPTVKANEGAEQKWAVWHNWIGPLFDQWDSNWNTKAALEEMQYNNQNADVSPINGFTFDPDAVATEVATVNSILTEIKPVICTGSMTDYDEYIAEARKRLEQAGIEKIKSEVQTQLDEWFKTK